MSPLPVKYKWDDLSAQRFTEVLSSQQFEGKLLDVEKDSPCDSNKLVNYLNTIIQEVCDLTLKKLKSHKSVPKNKPGKSRKKKKKKKKKITGLMSH